MLSQEHSTGDLHMILSKIHVEILCTKMNTMLCKNVCLTDINFVKTSKKNPVREGERECKFQLCKTKTLKTGHTANSLVQQS